MMRRMRATSRRQVLQGSLALPLWALAGEGQFAVVIVRRTEHALVGEAQIGAVFVVAGFKLDGVQIGAERLHRFGMVADRQNRDGVVVLAIHRLRIGTALDQNLHGNDIGMLEELRVIAAAVIGGTALAGGVGTIYGAVLGALIMQSLQSGMAMVGVDTPFQNVVVGLVLVIAVWVDIIYRKRMGLTK